MAKPNKDKPKVDKPKESKPLSAQDALNMLGAGGSGSAAELLKAAEVATLAAKSQGEIRRIDRMLRLKLRLLAKIETKESYI